MIAGRVALWKPTLPRFAAGSRLALSVGIFERRAAGCRGKVVDCLPTECGSCPWLDWDWDVLGRKQLKLSEADEPRLPCCR